MINKIEYTKDPRIGGGILPESYSGNHPARLPIRGFFIANSKARLLHWGRAFWHLGGGK